MRAARTLYIVSASESVAAFGAVVQQLDMLKRVKPSCSCLRHMRLLLRLLRVQLFHVIPKTVEGSRPGLSCFVLHCRNPTLCKLQAGPVQQGTAVRTVIDSHAGSQRWRSACSKEKYLQISWMRGWAES